MGIFDAILGRGGKNDEFMQGGMYPQDPYAQITQPIDPQLFPLINSPPGGGSELAQKTLDNQETIEQFRNGLKGYRKRKDFDIVTGKEVITIEKFGEPVMNENGINELCRDLEMYLSKPFILSNFPEKDKPRIDKMMTSIWRRVASKLIVNATRYELDKTRRPSITMQMVFIIYANIMRSYEDGERPRLYGTQKQVIHQSSYTNPTMQPKKNIFGF